MSDGSNHPQFPPLQISDLLVLTLSVAFTMASAAPIYQVALRTHDMKAWDVASELPLLLSIGISLFGLVVLARQRWRRAPYLLSPVHWVLVVIGPFSVLEMMNLWIMPLVSADLPTPWR